MILVTGATGHIGNVLVRALIEQGRRVRALVLPGEDVSPLSGLEVELCEGDICDREAVHTACKGVDLVYHLAGIISILPGRQREVERVNVGGTHNLLQVARQAGVRRLVYTSSIHAITRAPHGISIDEHLPYDPQHAISAYDRSKAQASIAVMQAAKTDLDTVLTCPTGVIGPFDFRCSEMGTVILHSLTHKILFLVRGAYNFVDVRDVVQGLILAGERGRRGESYILSGERLAVERLVGMVTAAAGRQVRRVFIPLGLARLASVLAPAYYWVARTRPLFTPYALATLTSNAEISYAKAHRELGYTPRILSETIADTVRWFQKENSIPSFTPA